MRFIGYLIRFFFPVLIPAGLVAGYYLTLDYMGFGPGGASFFGIVDLTMANESLVFYGALALFALGTTLAPIWEEDVPGLIFLTDRLTIGISVLMIFAATVTMLIPFLLVSAFFATLGGNILYAVPVAAVMITAYIVGGLTPAPKNKSVAF